MQHNELIPHLFRTEYSKIVAALCSAFGMTRVSLAEDIASDTFLQAAETWGLKGIPQNPQAWLYTVAKNKATDQFRRQQVFDKKVTGHLQRETVLTEENINELDLSESKITDSQLRMMFAVCHPAIPREAQIGLALRLLCGFGVEEIADAFLTNRETVSKRLLRAKEKLKAANVLIEMPPEQELNQRLDAVLIILYLMFNEGYHSSSQNTSLRKELCLDAMRLAHMLTQDHRTSIPAAYALLSLMCFHASRFDARTNESGDMILYEEQNEALWNTELMKRGEYYLNLASTGTKLSRYHLEAAIAYWHTIKENSHEKWESILQLYNKLLALEYSPIAALNRTYALAKANSVEQAIYEAEKLDLKDYHLYHSLMAHLYVGVDEKKAFDHLHLAHKLAKTTSDRKMIKKRIDEFWLK